VPENVAVSPKAPTRVSFVPLWTLLPVTMYVSVDAQSSDPDTAFPVWVTVADQAVLGPAGLVVAKVPVQLPVRFWSGSVELQPTATSKQSARRSFTLRSWSR